MTEKDLSALKIDPAAREGGWPRWLVPGVLSVLVVVIGLGALWVVGRGDVAPVRVAVAQQLSEVQSAVLNASGYVTPRRRATVSAKITGKLVEVLVEEGIRVGEGDVLARLDDVDAVASLRAAEADLGVSQARVDELAVELEDARRSLRRIRELHHEGVASQNELDGAVTRSDAVEAGLTRSRREVVAAETRVGVALRAVDNSVVRAPFAGVVVSKDAQPGEMVSPVSAGGGYTRTGIATIVDMASLEIEVDVNEAYIARVRTGQPVQAVLDAYPEWRIPSHVITVIPTADRQKATVRVRIGFDELDPRMLPDMGVRVTFMDEDEGSSASEPRVVVPRDAVREDGGQRVVFILDGDRVERRAVSVGQIRGGAVEALAGVRSGERVVVAGPADLRDGQTVRVEDGAGG